LPLPCRASLSVRADGQGLQDPQRRAGEFLRLTRDDPRADAGLRAFLRQAYNLKAIADYETGAGSEISAERAEKAVADAKRFVAHFAALVPAPPTDPDAGPNGSSPRIH
jgi:hypothetical protein